MHHPHREERGQPPARLAPSVHFPSWNSVLPGGYRKRQVRRPGLIPVALAAGRSPPPLSAPLKLIKFCGSKTPKFANLRCSGAAGWCLPVLLRKTCKNATKAASKDRVNVLLRRNQRYATRGHIQPCQIVPVDSPLESPAPQLRLSISAT